MTMTASKRYWKLAAVAGAAAMVTMMAGCASKAPDSAVPIPARKAAAARRRAARPTRSATTR